MKVEYDHNNSGGRWWLSDDDWRALEAAGWKVNWRPERFLGARAYSAEISGLPLDAAIAKWEEATGKYARAAGCACCGQPHFFTETDDNGKWVASGPDLHESDYE